MSADDTFQKVAQILSSQLHVDVSLIRLDSKLAGDLGADSLDTAELAMTVDEEFGYRLSDAEVINIKTVSDLIMILDTQITPKRRA